MNKLTGEKVSVVKDGTRYYCTAEIITVKGGQNVIYVTDSGEIITQEPLHRYKNRINRRKDGSKGYTLRVSDTNIHKYNRASSVRNTAYDEDGACSFLLGKELAEECRYALSLKRRRACDELESKYINATDICNKVGIIRGLRNTGKTIIMLQLAGRPEHLQQSAFLRLKYRREINVASICNQIDTLYRKHGIIYFYIDEVTFAEDFINVAADFSDTWATGSTVKIVLSGTDSLGFAFAQQDELYHRYREVLTTHIGYAEYSGLMEHRKKNEPDNPKIDSSVIGYIRSGGVFWDNDLSEVMLAGYLNTSVVTNIYNSINNISRVVPAATKLYGLTEDGMYSLCYSICKHAALTAACRKAESFWGAAFAEAVKDALGQSRAAIGRALGDITFNVTKHEEQAILSALGKTELHAGKFDEVQVFAAITLMKMSGFLYEVGAYTDQGDKYDDVELVFAQTGVAREFTRMVLRGIALSGVFTVGETPVILKTIEENADGVALESACMSGLIRRNKRKDESEYKLFKYRTFDGSHEVDIALLDYSTGVLHLYEVKRSEGKPDDSGSIGYVTEFARKHLAADSCVQPLIARFKPISVTRTLLYRGNNEEKIIDGIPVQYKNVEEFLRELDT